MNPSRKYRKLKNLIWKYPNRGLIGYLFEWDAETKLPLNLKSKSQLPTSDTFKAAFELYDEIEQLGIGYGELMEIFNSTVLEKVQSQIPTQQRKGETRDNKDKRVGSGGSGSSRIRFPKKKRKTAWKRFYRLFPNLNPK